MLFNNIRLTKIRLDNDNSDGTIEVVGATYLLNQDPFNSVGIDTRYNAIELQSTDGNGFPIAATTANAAADACYMAILPGEHDLILTYTIKDPTTNVEMEITKRVSGTFKSGEITDITANLSLPAYRFYFWDAETPIPPIIYRSPATGTFVVPDLTEDQMTSYNNGNKNHFYGAGRYDAQTEFFKKLPNVNEMMWYIYKGDPHWVSEGQGGICNWGEHLYRPEGIWLKKKAAILRDEHISEAYMRDGYPNKNNVYTDFRETDANIPDPGVPAQGTPTNISDYFFLPAASGYSHWGDGIGSLCVYWTSSVVPMSYSAYAMMVNQSSTWVSSFPRENAPVAMPFE